MKYCLSIIFCYFVIFVSSSLAAELWPAPLVLTDAYYSHHLLIAEKATHKIYLYSHQENNPPKLIKTYQMATGKSRGDKIFEGDNKTPEGIYSFTEFISQKSLLKRFGEEKGSEYGSGAFVTNYPNPVDKIRSKTGYGIWIHSTNDESRIDKKLDSEGCLVLGNADLKDLARYMELFKIPLVTVQNLYFISQDNRDKTRDEILSLLNSWLNAWRNKALNEYMSFYDKATFKDASKGSFAPYMAYKKAVFSNPGNPEINISDVSILQTFDYAVVTFTQSYKFSSINDIGKKTLYLSKNKNYDYKIVSELWSSLKEDYPPSKSFSPSVRFFSTNTISDNNELGPLLTL